MSLKRQAVSAANWSAITAVGMATFQILLVYVLSQLLTEEVFGLYALAMTVAAA
jgi:O-antigen/teichoic acid export membrane protein